MRASRFVFQTQPLQLLVLSFDQFWDTHHITSVYELSRKLTKLRRIDSDAYHRVCSSEIFGPKPEIYLIVWDKKPLNEGEPTELRKEYPDIKLDQGLMVGFA